MRQALFRERVIYMTALVQAELCDGKMEPFMYYYRDKDSKEIDDLYETGTVSYLQRQLHHTGIMKTTRQRSSDGKTGSDGSI